MRVVVSVDALVPPITGIGRYTWELIARLPRMAGVERVRFYRSGVWVGDPALFLADAAERERRPRLPRSLRSWYWRRALRDSVFHAPNYFLPREARCGVVTVHDLSVLKYPETHPAERVKQYEKSFRATLDQATHLITGTQATRAEVISYFAWPEDRITAVAPGVALDFAPRPASSVAPALRPFGLEPGRYVLCVSTIEPRKGIDALLDAYKILPAALRAAYPLVLAGGEGWRSEGLHDRIAEAQRAGWVRYLGFVPEAVLPMLYSGAQLFVYPSIYEGFGLPLAEAMAAGVPVVCSNRSCLPETAGGAARLVDPDDAPSLSAAIASALQDEAWRAAAITDGTRVAARYTWDDCARGTVAVYARAVAGM